MKSLVIAEKPSVAVDISSVLGGFTRLDGYLEKSDMIITWAVGHLIELAMPQEYDPTYERWDLNQLPILPDQFVLKAKPATQKQLRTIQSLIDRNDVDRLINACDAGREGELIFRYILQYLNCRKPHNRLWLSETTPAAVRNAFDNLRTSDEVDNLADAAICRSQADWIVGLNATRGYTVKHHNKLTVGRVQTPTLALIVNRDREIEGFTPQDYFEIEAEFSADPNTYKGKWFRDQQDRFFNRSEAETILNRLTRGSSGQIISIELKDKIEQPPQLFNLTDLQKEANKRFGFTAEQTLNITQKLYETHLLTYPRTNSRHLTEDMAATLPSRLNVLRRTELEPIVSNISDTNITNKRYVDNSKVTDHTAIIVTDTSPDLSSLSTDEFKIYVLIAKRMVGIFLPVAKYQLTTVITSCQDETFITKGKVLTEAGWKVLYTNPDEDETPSIPALTRGQDVMLDNAVVMDKQTQPPKRYTEADILSAMENAGRTVEDEALREAMRGKGLGTPATRAAIIEKLIQTGYITRQKKSLVATDKGKTLIDIVSPQLRDPVLTGEWEKKLLDIEQGKYHSSLFIQEIASFIGQIVNDIKAQADVNFVTTKEVLGTCPNCGKPVIEGKKGYGCSGWKEGCKFVVWKEIAGKKVSEAQAKKILQKGKSDLIKGFKSKKGNSFDAYLKLDSGNGNKVVLEFPARGSNL